MSCVNSYDSITPGEAASELARRTALVLGTSYGCLHSDVCFARGLEPGGTLRPAVFPYTLPSTCLGEVAI